MSPVKTRLPPAEVSDGAASKQMAVAVAHGGERRQQRRGKRRRVAVARHAGDDREARLVLGQRVGLLVVDHLQAMLDLAQTHIGRRKIVARRGIDPAAVGERRQHGERAAAAKRLVAAAGDQLLRLDEKLDLADAAAAELDVVARRPRSRRGRGDPGSAA